MATVSVRLSDQLNDEVEKMVEEGVFKETRLMHSTKPSDYYCYVMKDLNLKNDLV